MEEKGLYIAASCTIRNNSITKDGRVLFHQQAVSLQEFLFAAYDQFAIKYPKFYKMDQLSKLGWLASEVLLKDSFLKEAYQPDEVAIVLTNANASLDADIKYFASVKEYPSPALFVYTLPNIVIGEISIRNIFKGEHAFFIFEKFNADFLHKYVSGLFDNDIAKACICGWAEVVGEKYEAVLYLVTKDKTGIDFTNENLEKIYYLSNG